MIENNLDETLKESNLDETMSENNSDGEDGTEEHLDDSLLDSEGELVSGQRSPSRFRSRKRSYEEQKTHKRLHTDTSNRKGK